MPEYEVILNRLDALAEQNELLRGDVQATRASFEHRIRNGRRVIWMLVGVSLLSGYSALTSRSAADDAQNGVDQIRSSRAESRLASCQQDNVRIDQHNKLAEAVRGILNLTNSGAVRTPEQQARVDAFFANAYRLLDETIVAARDCTPDGLNAYYTTTTIPGG